MSDLDAAAIERALLSTDAALGRPLVISQLTESTNDDAKRAAREGAPSGAAFVAEAQSGGRGRLGRQWFSPPGENLYASFVLRPSFDARRVPLITLAAGLAVADAISPWLGDARVKLKWPNDVFVDDRKVAGILSEAHLSGEGAPWVVVGIGINVHTRGFPEDIATRATSLALSGATSLDRSALFVALATTLSARTEMLAAGAVERIIADVGARDALLGRTITVDGAPGVAAGIAEDGALRVRLPDGRETKCLAGDVQV